MTGPILVLGATGHVGRATVEALVGRGARVRALVRDPASALLPAQVEVARGDLTDPSSVAEAVRGTRGVFLLWPLIGHDPQALDALFDAERRIVHLSAADPGSDDVGDGEPGGIVASHRAIERLVRGRASTWAIIRSGGMATNTLGWAPMIRSGGPVRWVYGGATRPLVHERDLGEVAAAALLDGVLDGRVLDVTGAEALSQREQVQTIGRVVGRQIEWDEQTPGEARVSLLGQGWTEPMVDSALRAWADQAARPQRGTSGVREVLGRDPESFEAWVRDHVADFT